MQGVTPSSNPLYDGVPLEPAPSVRQVGTLAWYQWQPAAGSGHKPSLRNTITHSVSPHAAAGLRQAVPHKRLAARLGAWRPKYAGVAVAGHSSAN